MKIDRSNYEIWLIDWFDGNLNEFQIEQLQHFLTVNHDLKEESDELTMFRLNPGRKSFPHKNQLKKTMGDLSPSQFEYLSVAYIENDLSAEEKTELLESIEYDQGKKISFELIKKLRLSPDNLSYKHKKRLLKRTLAQNAIRWSMIGLSAAAITTLVIFTSDSKPHELKIDSNKTAQSVSVDSAVLKQTKGIVSNAVYEGSHNIPDKIQKKTIIASLKTTSSNPEIKNNLLAEIDSMSQSVTLTRTIINKITVPPSIDLKGEPIHNTLIALNPSVTVPEYDDGRSKLSRFIARTFREKFRGHWTGIELGFNNYVTSANSLVLPSDIDYMTLHSSKSSNFNINFTQLSLGLTRHIGFVTGLGLNWNNYRFDGNNSIVKGDNGVIQVLDPGARLEKSKLASLYLTLPFMLELQLPVNNNHLTFGAGPIGAIKLSSHTKMVFEDGRTIKSWGDFSLNMLRYGAIARVGYGNFQIYGTYYKTPLFQTGKGPGGVELYPFEIGVALTFND